MSAEAFLLTLVGILIVVYAFVALAACLRARGTRLFILDTEEPGAGTVDTGHAAVSGTRENAADALSASSSRREEPRRDKASTAHATGAPADTHGRKILSEWFAGKRCAFCERPIPPIHRVEQHPGLMNIESPGHDLISWNDILRDQRLPAMLESHVPVCSNCIIAETLRRQYPDLVVDRPEHGRNHLTVH